MKRPRIEDIDATAAIDSTWENMPQIQKPPRRVTQSQTSDATPNMERPSSLRQYAPYGSTDRRVMKRHPFEIYQDQLDQLRRFAETDKRKGGSGSMSEMVRGVLDRLIAERKKQEGSD